MSAHALGRASGLLPVKEKGNFLPGHSCLISTQSRVVVCAKPRPPGRPVYDTDEGHTEGSTWVPPIGIDGLPPLFGEPGPFDRPEGLLFDTLEERQDFWEQLTQDKVPLIESLVASGNENILQETGYVPAFTRPPFPDWLLADPYALLPDMEPRVRSPQPTAAQQAEQRQRQQEAHNRSAAGGADADTADNVVWGEETYVGRWGPIRLVPYDQPNYVSTNTRRRQAFQEQAGPSKTAQYSQGCGKGKDASTTHAASADNGFGSSGAKTGNRNRGDSPSSSSWSASPSDNIEDGYATRGFDPSMPPLAALQELARRDARLAEADLPPGTVYYLGLPLHTRNRLPAALLQSVEAEGEAEMRKLAADLGQEWGEDDEDDGVKDPEGDEEVRQLDEVMKAWWREHTGIGSGRDGDGSGSGSNEDGDFDRFPEGEGGLSSKGKLQRNPSSSTATGSNVGDFDSAGGRGQSPASSLPSMPGGRRGQSKSSLEVGAADPWGGHTQHTSTSGGNSGQQRNGGSSSSGSGSSTTGVGSQGGGRTARAVSANLPASASFSTDSSSSRTTARMHSTSAAAQVIQHPSTQPARASSAAATPAAVASNPASPQQLASSLSITPHSTNPPPTIKRYPAMRPQSPAASDRGPSSRHQPLLPQPSPQQTALNNTPQEQLQPPPPQHVRQDSLARDASNTLALSTLSSEGTSTRDSQRQLTPRPWKHVKRRSSSGPPALHAFPPSHLAAAGKAASGDLVHAAADAPARASVPSAMSAATPMAHCLAPSSSWCLPMGHHFLRPVFSLSVQSGNSAVPRSPSQFGDSQDNVNVAHRVAATGMRNASDRSRQRPLSMSATTSPHLHPARLLQRDSHRLQHMPSSTSSVAKPWADETQSMSLEPAAVTAGTMGLSGTFSHASTLFQAPSKQQASSRRSHDRGDSSKSSGFEHSVGRHDVSHQRQPAYTAADKVYMSSQQRQELGCRLRTAHPNGTHQPGSSPLHFQSVTHALSRQPTTGRSVALRTFRIFKYGLDDLRLFKALDEAGMEGRVVVTEQLAGADVVLAVRRKRTGKDVPVGQVKAAAKNAGIPFVQLQSMSALRVMEAIAPLMGIPLPPHLLTSKPPRVVIPSEQVLSSATALQLLQEGVAAHTEPAPTPAVQSAGVRRTNQQSASGSAAQRAVAVQPAGKPTNNVVSPISKPVLQLAATAAALRPLPNVRNTLNALPRPSVKWAPQQPTVQHPVAAVWAGPPSNTTATTALGRSRLPDVEFDLPLDDSGELEDMHRAALLPRNPSDRLGSRYKLARPIKHGARLRQRRRLRAQQQSTVQAR